MRTLQRRLIVLVLAYGVLGVVSQKLVPGVDEVIPFASWSLFSSVPNRVGLYTIELCEQDGRNLEPPLDFRSAPSTIVVGNRSIAGKVIQSLGRAVSRGDAAKTARLANLLEREFLRGRVRYRLSYESYRPLQKWKTGRSEEHRIVARFDGGERLADPNVD